MEEKTIFVVDWDGVCQTNVWPEWGEWIDGAIAGLERLLELGEVRIYSARLNPYQYGYDGIHKRPHGEWLADCAEMRKRLDSVGLFDVHVHTTHGKPSGTYYIDDRAVEFKGSWDDVLITVEARQPDPVNAAEMLDKISPTWPSPIVVKGLASVKSPPPGLDFGPEWRDTDPVTGGSKGRKQAVFANMSLIADVLEARVHGFGVQKYPDESGVPNWSKGMPWSWFYDALRRHIAAYWSGETINPESGLPHLAHARWMISNLLEYAEYGMGTDDRPKWRQGAEVELPESA